MTTAELIGADPGWLIVVKALIVFAVCVLLTLMSVWGERRVVGRMQQRPGPNRVGPFGLIQALADGVKLALKEDLIPAAADKIVFIAAPIIAAAMCFMSFAVIPMTGVVTLFGRETAMQLTDLLKTVNFITTENKLHELMFHELFREQMEKIWMHYKSHQAYYYQMEKHQSNVFWKRRSAG